MRDDFLNSYVADQLHDDLLVERLTDGDSTAVAADLEKAVSLDDVPKSVAKKFFSTASLGLAAKRGALEG
ncbi:MAG TPA: hypothetical protein VLC73_12845 [Burkholderiales bacterium]|nr:hypothetical protein [Burkholderiales bacterium]